MKETSPVSRSDAVAWICDPGVGEIQSWVICNEVDGHLIIVERHIVLKMAHADAGAAELPSK
jgi:hypothetical protein